MLDVGAGGGAASLPLTPPAGVLIPVDESQAMLDVFGAGWPSGAGCATERSSPAGPTSPPTPQRRTWSCATARGVTQE